ncbi:MAG: alpha/beta hydrolase [Alphaproteobacteria bacterium]|jgi:pimeloyl-ACP methyl ester carboxylesterase|nr:alpha/beta hydrolase [Alphaproteobacteria bacterium]MBT5828020.1 alpha/beta hydrolase [Alphaproteobacteria bacterium]
MKEGQVLKTKEGYKLIYDQIIGDDNYIVFLAGLSSDRKATKASFFKNYAKAKGYSYICFDYLGHGDSDLEFSQCDINMWLSNVKDILANLVPKKAIIIGSSLGGWLALRLAELDDSKIKAIIGLASAPDFTESLMWNDFSIEVKAKLERGEIYNLPSDYCDGEYKISMGLINSGRDNLLLNKAEININIPVRLVQGMQDDDVPYEYGLKLIEKLKTKDAELCLIKNADHRLSDLPVLNKISHILEDLIAT